MRYNYIYVRMHVCTHSNSLLNQLQYYSAINVKKKTQLNAMLQFNSNNNFVKNIMKLLP